MRWQGNQMYVFSLPHWVYSDSSASQFSRLSTNCNLNTWCVKYQIGELLFCQPADNLFLCWILSVFLCLAKLVIRWVDITQLEKNATLLFPDLIKVSTRSSEHFFSVFLNISETFKLMEQLANIAMRQLLDNEGFEQDRSLPKLKKKSPKKVSALKR